MSQITENDASASSVPQAVAMLDRYVAGLDKSLSSLGDQLITIIELLGNWPVEHEDAEGGRAVVQLCVHIDDLDELIAPTVRDWISRLRASKAKFNHARGTPLTVEESDALWEDAHRNPGERAAWVRGYFNALRMTKGKDGNDNP